MVRILCSCKVSVIDGRRLERGRWMGAVVLGLGPSCAVMISNLMFGLMLGVVHWGSGEGDERTHLPNEVEVN